MGNYQKLIKWKNNFTKVNDDPETNENAEMIKIDKSLTECLINSDQCKSNLNDKYNNVDSKKRKLITDYDVREVAKKTRETDIFEKNQSVTENYEQTTVKYDRPKINSVQEIQELNDFKHDNLI